MTYIAFVGDSYYPQGGWEDFEGQFCSLEKAKGFVEEKFPDAEHKWAHIVFNNKIILFGQPDSDLLLQKSCKWEWREHQ